MKRPFDLSEVQLEFPILQRPVRGKGLTYLDSAATTLKPETVVERLSQHYLFETSNIHRGVYFLSEQATAEYENVRNIVASFIGAGDSREVVFTKGTTEGLNLLAFSMGEGLLKSGDEILISQMEHHSNIVPWQMLCQRKGLKLKVVPITDSGELDLQAFDELLTEQVKVVSLVHVSNSLGTINPIGDLFKKAKAIGALTVLDAAQSVSTVPVDVRNLGCDFMVFSAHKLFGPNGAGVLWGRLDLLEKLPPYQGGGDMIASVTFEKTTYNQVPFKFEAGTPPIAEVIGMGAAIQYFSGFKLPDIMAHEKALLDYGTRRLREIPGLRIIGEAQDKAPVLSFVLGDIHPHDIGTLLDQEGICVRTGHHCTQPVMQKFQIPATTRASLSIYNSKEDIDNLVKGLMKVIEVFK